MATLTLARTTLLQRGASRASRLSRILPLCTTLGLGAFVTASNLSMKPLQLDTTTLAAPCSSKPNSDEKLNPEVIRQMAGGSAAGFMAGLVVSIFSKTLVLFAGIFMAVVQIAAWYGTDLIKYFQLKERLKSSRIIALLRNHQAFKLSFAITFTLAAFAHF